MSKLTRTYSLHGDSEPRLLPKPASPKPGAALSAALSAAASRPPLPHAWMRPKSASIKGRGAGARGGVKPLNAETLRRLDSIMGAPASPPRAAPPPLALGKLLQRRLKAAFDFNQPHLVGLETRGPWLAAAGRNRRGTMSAEAPTRRASSPGRSKLSKTRKKSASPKRGKSRSPSRAHRP